MHSQRTVRRALERREASRDTFERLLAQFQTRGENLYVYMGQRIQAWRSPTFLDVDDIELPERIDFLMRQLEVCTREFQTVQVCPTSLTDR